MHKEIAWHMHRICMAGTLNVHCYLNGSRIAKVNTPGGVGDWALYVCTTDSEGGGGAGGFAPRKLIVVRNQ
jgi:hypothetical protein